MQPLNTQLLIVSLIIFICTIKLVITASRGDSCFDNYRKLNGTCKYISDCYNVLQLKYHGRPYVRCGYEDRMELVCCGEIIVTVPNKTESPNAHMKYFRECEQYKSQIFTESNCNQSPLVVDGEDANPKEFPHMALLGCSDGKGKIKWICGGTLISKNYILTAAHCVTAYTCDNITDVRLGELDLNSVNDDAQPKDYKVGCIIAHPSYNESLKYHDIALIELATDVEFNQYVRPACLPYDDYTADSKLIITGWGHTQNAGKNSPHLQKATIKPFDHEKCNEIWTEDDYEKLPIGVRERIQICAGSIEGNKDTCQGDSGGPLQIVHPKYPCMYSVVGITSAGQACGIPGIPAIYTRTFHYIDWIEKIVWD